MSETGGLDISPNWRVWLIRWRSARGEDEELAAREASLAAAEWRGGQGQAGTEQRAKNLVLRSSEFKRKEEDQNRDKLSHLRELCWACVKALGIISIVPAFLGLCYLILLWA